MNKETFGNYIRKAREAKNLPLRKVAIQLDIDTSTLSKVERGERPSSKSYLKPLSTILQIELKEIETIYIVDKITKDFEGFKHLSDGLKEVEKQIKKDKK